MTVDELIEILKTYPSDAEITIEWNDKFEILFDDENQTVNIIP